ncbi:MAG: SusC/RagA family TonB-linked outer membrane protein [Flavobacteriaceae bacterium]|nr:SusC/RagA family TonB-linked outer membrane protein [Flavobacteriaceae bacterium]
MLKNFSWLSFFTLSTAFLLCGQLSAQYTISGQVVDADTNDPLLGVSVLLQGTTLGTVTDFDGNYTLPNIESGNYVLVVSYTGYSSNYSQIEVGTSDIQQNFELTYSASQLNEIVVTGTGSPVEKKKLGNSIGSITTAQLQDLPINSFSDILQGREPGIVTLPGSGLTGEGSAIRIRGSASLSQLNEPIVLIDGIRVDAGGGFGGGLVGSGGGGSTSRLDDINPESIERIEILKGASAATLFGTEASNGVIQIFTKRGRVGQPLFNFKITQGFINYPKGRVADNTGWTSSATQIAAVSEVLGRTIRPYELITTNALEDLYETGIQNTFSGDIQGGTNLFSYYGAARYSYTDGPFGGKNRTGYTEGQETLAADIDELAQLNLNFTINPSSKLNIKVTSGFTARNASTMQNNNNIYGVGSLAQFSKPELIKPTNTTGTIAFATVDETLQISIGSEINHFNGVIGLNYTANDWLKLQGTFGLDYSSQTSTEFWPFGYNIDGFSGANPLGARYKDSRDFLSQSVEIKASFNNQISESITSDFILGGQYVSQETKVVAAQGEDFPGPGFAVTSAAANQSTFEFYQETINAGVFAQEQIGLNNQFFFTVGARLDAHSAFGTEFDAAFYPKVSLSYVPSDGPKWSDLGPISSLQIRSSYGFSGLQPGAFDALTTYQALASATGAGIAPNNLGNSELAPEVSQELEVGFTAGLAQDRVNFEFTYWDRVTKDALYARQFVLSGGFRNPQLTNIGELSAFGLEFNLNGSVIRGQDRSLDLFINGAYYRDEIVSLGGAPPLKVGGSYPRYRNFLREGDAPGSNFGAKLIEVGDNQLPVDIANQDGLPDTRDQLLAFFQENINENLSVPTTVGIGGVLLEDEDGDGDLLDHYLGKPTPDWTGSFGGAFNFKNFTFSTNFEFKFGNYVVNNLTDAFRQANAAIGRNLPRSARVTRDYHTGGVDASFTPMYDPNVRLDALNEWLYETLALAPFSGLNTLEKADFLRWREVSLVYRFDNDFIENFGFETASLGVSGRNVALFTSYSGVDPEINYLGRGSGTTLGQNFGQGNAAFGWPIPTQVILTLKVGF